MFVLFLIQWPCTEEEGWTTEEVLCKLRELKEAEEERWKCGHVSGVVYHGGEEHMLMQSKVLILFANYVAGTL